MKRLTPRRRILAIAGLVVVLLLIADRASARIAGAKVASELGRSIHCVTGATISPSVSIQGFPFLADVARRTFASVRVTADDATLDDMSLTQISVTARDVTAPEGEHPATIGRLSGRATVPWSTLPQQVDGRTLRYGATADGRLTISTIVKVSVLPVPVTVIASTTLAGGVLTVTPQDVRVLGIGGSIAELSTGIQQPLPALPPGMSYGSATPTGAGMVVTLTGRDLEAPALDTTSCVW